MRDGPPARQQLESVKHAYSFSYHTRCSQTTCTGTDFENNRGIWPRPEVPVCAWLRIRWISNMRCDPSQPQLAARSRTSCPCTVLHSSAPTNASDALQRWVQARCERPQRAQTCVTTRSARDHGTTLDAQAAQAARAKTSPGLHISICAHLRSCCNPALGSGHSHRLDLGNFGVQGHVC